MRELEEVIGVAARHGLAHRETVPMPANNRSVIFLKEDRAAVTGG